MDILVGRKKMESLARRSNIVVGKREGTKRKESGNVTRIKTGIAIEGNWGNWKKGKKRECCGKNGEKLSVGRRRLLNPNFASSKILLEIPIFVFAPPVQECFRPVRALVYLPLFIGTNQGSWLALGCKWSNWGKRHNLMISYVTIGQEAYNNPKLLAKEA